MFTHSPLEIGLIRGSVLGELGCPARRDARRSESLVSRLVLEVRLVQAATLVEPLAGAADADLAFGDRCSDRYDRISEDATAPTSRSQRGGQTPGEGSERPCPERCPELDNSEALSETSGRLRDQQTTSNHRQTGDS